MKTSRMIAELGLKPGRLFGLALEAAEALRKAGLDPVLPLRQALDPDAPLLSEADAVPDAVRPALERLRAHAEAEAASVAERARLKPRDAALPYADFGGALVDDAARAQMETAMRLPVAALGALMPDAHVGYGLPIGGVLATDDAVVPYAVGVDIACRMMLTVYPVDEAHLARHRTDLVRAIEKETAFGAGAGGLKRSHPVLDDPRFGATGLLRKLKDKAAHQLGSSGGGNHFVEWGLVEAVADVADEDGDPALSKGQTYLALLSHSGSRGVGFAIANHYTEAAMKARAGLPDAYKHLAWLRLGEEDGAAYWEAMHLAGAYASACHHTIHKHVARAAGLKPILAVENHHNFCLPGDQRVPTPAGPVRMDALRAGDTVYAFDPLGGIVPTEVTWHGATGRKPLVTVETRNRRLRCTADHPLLVVEVAPAPHPARPWTTRRTGRFAWKNAGDVQPGDVLVCAEGFFASDGDLAPETARLMGAFVADGWVRALTAGGQGYDVGLAIGGPGEPHTARYKALLEAVFENGPVWRDNARGAYGLTCTNKAVHAALHGWGVAARSKDARVPAAVFAASDEAKRAFLAGYLDGDGSVSANPKNAGRGTVATVSEGLARDLHALALGLCLRATPVRAATVTTNHGTATVHRFTLSADSVAALPLWHEGKASNQRTTRHGRPQGLAPARRGYLDLPDGTFAQTVCAVTPGETAEVYDLTVAHPGHAFVCEGVVVHNCWREEHDGRTVYVHRKGATPAGAGVRGIIPGSMAAPGFLVEGLGNADALASASHGAGRQMGRKAAERSISRDEMREALRVAGVELLGGGRDEAPQAYKPIAEVMAAQTDLVRVLARFRPKIVRMASDNAAF